MSLSKIKYNHMIVWLDENVALPDFCKQLKKAFATTTNTEMKTLTNITEQDISNLISDGSTYGETTFLNVPFIFKLFSQIEPCLRYLLRNCVHMRIFFLTSGSLGEFIVPRILQDYPEIFKDKDGKFYEDSIYIFCAATAKHGQWAYDYLDLDCIKMENDDRAMLARLTRDIAKYFVSQGKQLCEKDDISLLNDSKQYFIWARKLYINADLVRKMPSTSTLINELDQWIVKTDEKINNLNTGNNNDDDTIISEEN